LVQLQQWMTIPHDLIFFSIFFQEFIIKHIKTETNRYAKSVEDKLSRTIKLSLKAYGKHVLE
jgi:hypothetical protein